MIRTAAVLSLSLWLSTAAAIAQGPADASAKQAQAATAQLTIGVVDFAKIFDAYPRVAEERKRYDEFRKGKQQALSDEEKKLKAMKMEAESFQTGTAERALKDLEIRAFGDRLEGLQSIYQTELRRKMEELQVDWYEDAGRAIKIVAEERKLSLVLRIYGDVEGARAKATVFDLRTVWYANDEVDITGAVIKLLQAGLPPLPKDPKAAGAPKDGTVPKDGAAPKDGAKDGAAKNNDKNRDGK